MMRNVSLAGTLLSEPDTSVSGSTTRVLPRSSTLISARRIYPRASLALIAFALTDNSLAFVFTKHYLQEHYYGLAYQNEL